MDVGTGLDSRPCLVSIYHCFYHFADLTSLYTSPFISLLIYDYVHSGYIIVHLHSLLLLHIAVFISLFKWQWVKTAKHVHVHHSE